MDLQIMGITPTSYNKTNNYCNTINRGNKVYISQPFFKVVTITHSYCIEIYVVAIWLVAIDQFFSRCTKYLSTSYATNIGTHFCSTYRWQRARTRWILQTQTRTGENEMCPVKNPYPQAGIDLYSYPCPYGNPARAQQKNRFQPPVYHIQIILLLG
jgi:hypothetical protein